MATAADVSSAQRQGNLSYPFVKNLATRWDMFREVAGACRDWKRAATKPWYFWTNTSWNVARMLFMTTHPNVDAFQCYDLVSTGEFWRIDRVGPFNSTGGFDWHSIIVRDILGLRSVLWQNSGFIALKAMATCIVNEQGTVIGYPPMHNHHTQTVLEFAGSSYENAIQLQHQDSNCYPLLGGDHCALYEFPANHGIWIDTPLRAVSLMNDVRPMHSSSLSFYFEVAGHLDTVPPKRRIHLWKSNSAGPVYGPFGGFRIPADEESVVWTTVLAEVSGRLLTLWIHVHISFGYIETWYIDATSNDLGLDIFSVQTPCSPAFLPSRAGITSQVVKRRILTRMHELNFGFRCTSHRLTPHDNSYGDRQPILRCFEGSENLVAGTVITAVHFFVGTDSEGEYLQHSHYQVYFESTNMTQVTFLAQPIIHNSFTVCDSHFIFSFFLVRIPTIVVSVIDAMTFNFRWPLAVINGALHVAWLVVGIALIFVAILSTCAVSLCLRLCSRLRTR